MLFPELKQRRDKIRILMAQQGIDAALIACNVNLIYTLLTREAQFLTHKLVLMHIFPLHIR